MNTKRARITLNNTILDSDIPINCPYCNAYVEPLPTDLKAQNFNDFFLYTIIFRVNCCKKDFFSAYRKNKSNNEAVLLVTYPPTTAEKIPDPLKEISPRFDSLFTQASTAESMGFTELAGSGYRNALEVLIKDYAINELGVPEEEASRKKLYDAIGAYVPSVAITAADVIRVLGNDYTHFQRKYDDIDFQVMKRYLHILIQAIENDYLLRHPVVNTNRS